MRCRKGDLAIVINAHPTWHEYLGRIVEVVSIASNGEWRLNVKWHGFGVTCPDHFLSPLRDPGDDATDETLLWKPVPVKETA